MFRLLTYYREPALSKGMYCLVGTPVVCVGLDVVRIKLSTMFRNSYTNLTPQGDGGSDSTKKKIATA